MDSAELLSQIRLVCLDMIEASVRHDAQGVVNMMTRAGLLTDDLRAMVKAPGPERRVLADVSASLAWLAAAAHANRAMVAADTVLVP